MSNRTAKQRVLPPPPSPGRPPSRVPGSGDVVLERNPRSLAEEGIAALRRAENAQQEANALRTRMFHLMAQNETLKQDKAKLEERVKQLEHQMGLSGDEQIEYYKNLTAQWEKYGTKWEQEAQYQRRRADEAADQLKDAMKELERWQVQTRDTRVPAPPPPPPPPPAKTADDEFLIRLFDSEPDDKKATTKQGNPGDLPRAEVLALRSAAEEAADGSDKSSSES